MGLESDDTNDGGLDEAEDDSIPSSDSDREGERLESIERAVEKSPKGRFTRFNRRLGTGAFKAVYLAFDSETGREVAWSIIPFKRMNKHSRKQLDTEIKLAASLDHPRILKFISSWINREKGEVVFITERITGGSLWSYIRRLQSPIKLKIIRMWAKQILEGLAFLHNHQPNPIIHRDLKLANIFVNGSDANVVIGDFGLCTTLLSDPATSLVGTPEFMAPEIYDEIYGTAVDIYAFGMCLLQMITRKMPFSECCSAGQVYKKMMSGQKPIDVSRIRNPSLKAVVEACLSHDPSQRPSACDLLGNPFWDRNENADEFVDLYEADDSSEHMLT
jgi:WNK lysine deficient protein kinase